MHKLLILTIFIFTPNVFGYLPCINYLLPEVPLLYNQEICLFGGCQCGDPTQDWFYRRLCEFDCQCNHNKAVGACAYNVSGNPAVNYCICSGTDYPHYVPGCVYPK